MKHLTDEQLSARLDGELPARQAEEAERHLAACAACRERLAALAGSDAALARSLDRDPGEKYFASFADRVQARIASGAGAEARGRSADAAPRRSWFGSPATLAWAGAAAALLVVGALAVRIATQQVAGGGSAAEQPSIVGADRLEQRQRDAAAPPAAAPAPEGARANETPSPAPAEAEAQRADEPAARVPAASGSSSALADERITTPGARAKDEAVGIRVGDEDRRPPLAPQRLQELRTLPSGEQVPVQSRPLPQAGAQKNFAVPPADASKPRKPVAMPMAPQPSLKKVVTQEETRAPESRADESKLGATAAPAPKATGSVAPATEAASGLTSAQADEAATVRLCGTVANAQGRALEGATVTVVETGRSVVAGAGGSFCVEAPSRDATLSVLALGYHEYRASVRDAEATPLAISLRSVDALGPGGAPAARLKAGPPPVAATKEVPEVSVQGSRDRAAFGATKSLLDRAPASPGDVTTARAATEAARLAKSATLWTKAGALGTGVAAAAKPGAEADEARFRAAEARMSAWRLAPTGPNRVAALAAIGDFVAKAPAGARRDSAEAWRRELPAR